MKRREFMNQTASLGIIAAAVSLPDSLTSKLLPATADNKLTPPAKGKIPVAFTISEGVTVIDFAGPWEVFQDVMVMERGQNHDDQMPFELFTVSETNRAPHGIGRAANWSPITLSTPRHKQR